MLAMGRAIMVRPKIMLLDEPSMALSIADKAYVLETGKIVLSGDAEELLNDDKVRSAYLLENKKI